MIDGAKKAKAELDTAVKDSELATNAADARRALEKAQHNAEILRKCAESAKQAAHGKTPNFTSSDDNTSAMPIFEK